MFCYSKKIKLEPDLCLRKGKWFKIKKIVFGITSLTIGGAERVLVDITNRLKDNYEITIFTLYSKGSFEKEIDKKINIVSLYNNSYDELSKIKRIIIPIKVLICGKFVYKKYLQDKFDVQVAFLEGPITRIFKYGKNIKKIVWIHNDISKVFGNDLKAKIKLKLDKNNYKKYDKLIFVSKDNKDRFNDLYKLKEIEKKQEIIYNYIDKDRILKMSEVKIDDSIIDKKILSIIVVARLVKQKAIDRLIRIHKRLIEDGISHKIYIIGDGPEKEKLQELIKNLNVENSFILMGKKENPYPYIKKADFFLLLSEFEGYGMVIEEAKILSKNIIITNTAAKEAIVDYSKKLILDNTENAIYNGLKKVLKKEIIFENDKNYIKDDSVIEKIEAILNE